MEISSLWRLLKNGKLLFLGQVQEFIICFCLFPCGEYVILTENKSIIQTCHLKTKLDYLTIQLATNPTISLFI